MTYPRIFQVVSPIFFKYLRDTKLVALEVVSQHRIILIVLLGPKCTLNIIFTWALCDLHYSEIIHVDETGKMNMTKTGHAS